MEIDFKAQWEAAKRAEAVNLLASAARRATLVRREPFEVALGDFDLPDFCPVLGTPLAWVKDPLQSGRGNRPTLDRINPALGYAKGNVRVISQSANSRKQ